MKLSDDLQKGLKHYKSVFFIKRIFDIVFSIFVLALFFVPGVVICLFIMRDGGSAFFSQERMGYKGRVFNIYKFRSMYQGSEKLEDVLLDHSESGFVQRDNDERITSVGRFLRKTSLDEIPQFFNVLKGDMSLIGPRPLLALEVNRLDAYYQQRNLVLPGLSGLAQLKRQEKLSILETAKEDLRYIREYSLCKDIRIVFATIFVFFKGR